VPVLIAAPGCEGHAHGLGIRLGLPVLVPELRLFPDGELYVRLAGEVRAAGSAPPMCVAIHAVFADALQGTLLEAGARDIVTCDTIPHAPNRIAIADSLADAVRERVA
jgi:ribose-phosphate pyrophosphokinase